MRFAPAGRALSLFLALAVALLLSCSQEPAGQHDEPRYRIGLLTNNPNGLRNLGGFREGMQSLGYIEGKNLTWLDGVEPVSRDELEEAVRAMVAEGADLIFTAGTPTGVAARKATIESAVPVVFGVIADPVAAGVMEDLNRPGANLTGVMLSPNQARRLELLHTLFPAVKRILVPYNPHDTAPVSAVAQIEPVAEKLGLQLVHARARNDEEVTAMLAAFPADIDAVFMLPDSTVNRRVKDLLALAAERRVPVSGPSAAQVEAGALMSYGIAHREVGVQAARIADRVLRGADPGLLPVEVANFYLTLNLAAATRIGVELREPDLQQADNILYDDRFGR